MAAPDKKSLQPHVLPPIPDFNIAFEANVRDPDAKQALLARRKEIESLGGEIEYDSFIPDMLRITFNDSEKNPALDPAKFSAFLDKVLEVVPIKKFTYAEFLFYEEMGKLRFTPRLKAPEEENGHKLHVETWTNGEPVRSAEHRFPDGTDVSLRVERNESNDPKRSYDVIGEISWSKDAPAAPLSRTMIESMMENMISVREHLLTALNAAQRLPPPADSKELSR